jgi:hypothetical protein
MNSVHVRAQGISIEISPRTITVAVDGPEAPVDLGRHIASPEAGPICEKPAQLYAQRIDGVVFAPLQGLVWSAEDVVPKACNHAAAEKACKELRLGGFDDWRLPTIQELLTLVDYSRSEPAIDTAKFPACKSTWYWTSTPVASSPDYAWVVYFDNGGADYGRRDSHSALARAVRSVAPGQ